MFINRKLMLGVLMFCGVMRPFRVVGERKIPQKVQDRMKNIRSN